MANRSVELAIRMTADVDKVSSSFDQVGDSALRMGDDVDRASRLADSSTSRLGNAADAADGLGSSSSQAAGGLGDLGGALSLLPGPLGALGAGMEAASPAIMGVTGAADLANLALDKGRAVTSKLTAAVKANVVVTKAAAIAQKVLNVAMRANPIGLIIVAITAAVALFVVLYKRSETFRKGVDTLKNGVVKAFEFMLKPIGAVIDLVKSVVGWVGDAIDATKRAIGLGKDYKSLMGGVINDTLEGLAQIGQQVGNQVRGATNTVTPSEAAGGGRGRVVVVEEHHHYEFPGVVTDPDAVARKIDKVQRRRSRSTGALFAGAVL